ncbi:MAG: PBSX family phage terminase large subunit [Defluviitaleaceae bacterium]|nr:PBSX family phage terminase large subunit [Defluviitaleaceae bacterium]
MKINKKVNAHFERYLWDFDHKFYLLVGGYGSSKSYHTALKLIVKLFMEKRTAIVVRNVYATLKDSCFSLLVEIIEDIGLLEFVDIHSSPLEIRFCNGSKILFKGMDKPEKIKSINNITLVWVEECAEVSYEGFKELLGRLRHPTLPLHFLLTTNPVDKSNWVYRHFFESNGIEEQFYQTKELSIGDVYYNHSTVMDNSFITSDYVSQLDELIEYDEDLYRVARLGQFGVCGVRVFPQFEVMPHKDVIAMTEKSSRPFYRIGMDFGFETSFNAVVWMVIDVSEKVLYLYREYYKNRMTDDVTADELLELDLNGEVIWADSAEPKTISYFNKRGIKMIGARKFPGSRLANLKKVKRFKRIICSDRCPNIIRELSGLSYAKDGFGGFVADKFNIDAHTLSAVWYGLDGIEVLDVKEFKSFSGKGRR